MALQTSGSIDLNAMHVEAGGTSGTSVTINDSDIRALISKGAGASMSFDEWYGASAEPDGFYSSYITTSSSNLALSYNSPANPTISISGGAWVMVRGASGGGAAAVRVERYFAANIANPGNGGAGASVCFYLSDITDLIGANLTVGAGGAGGVAHGRLGWGYQWAGGGAGGTTSLSWSNKSVSITGGGTYSSQTGSVSTSNITTIANATAASQAQSHWGQYSSITSNIDFTSQAGGTGRGQGYRDSYSNGNASFYVYATAGSPGALSIVYAY